MARKLNYVLDFNNLEKSKSQLKSNNVLYLTWDYWSFLYIGGFYLIWAASILPVGIVSLTVPAVQKYWILNQCSFWFGSLLHLHIKILWIFPLWKKKSRRELKTKTLYMELNCKIRHLKIRSFNLFSAPEVPLLSKCPKEYNSHLPNLKDYYKE